MGVLELVNCNKNQIILKVNANDPLTVAMNHCFSAKMAYITVTRSDVGLLSPNGQRIYSRYSPYHPLGKYGNVPVKDNLYHWYHSGIYLDSIITWQKILLSRKARMKF